MSIVGATRPFQPRGPPSPCGCSNAGASPPGPRSRADETQVFSSSPPVGLPEFPVGQTNRPNKLGSTAISTCAGGRSELLALQGCQTKNQRRWLKSPNNPRAR
ncbi:hypothetical protein BD779DRAFT_1526739 [Infundibulicybe gibba]|nr:hypothetical protein BD779DRAFT_1526739 [Infundibulicybe gibba]